MAETFAALGHRFGVSGSSATLGRFFADALRSLGSTGPAGSYHLAADGQVFEISGPDATSRTGALGRIGTELMTMINAAAVNASRDLLLLHAGAVARGGRAIVLPAPMESGKTTLVAGLVARGLDYVTDETVAIEPGTLAIHAYPKPLSIDRGSWDVLADLRPTRFEQFQAEQWLVPCDDIRPDSLAGPCQPTVIIAPRYDPGQPTRLELMRGSEAAILLAENSFNFKDDGRAWLPTVGAIAERCPAYRLSVSNLDEACDLVMSLVGSPASVG